MADSTTVNPQITDNLTQSNAKVLAESPAIAVGTLYQSLAHATSLLFENAVAAAQQQTTLAQAATNQGVIHIYSAVTDTAAPDRDVASPPEAVHAQMLRAVENANTAHATQMGSVQGLVVSAVRLSNEAVLGHAGDVAYAVRAGAETLAAGLHAIGQSLHEDRMRMLRTAASAACVEGMLRDPSKTAEYEAILAAVATLK